MAAKVVVCPVASTPDRTAVDAPGGTSVPFAVPTVFQPYSRPVLPCGLPRVALTGSPVHATMGCTVLENRRDHRHSSLEAPYQPPARSHGVRFPSA